MFDRSAITEGRLIQEFGLCDLKGVYQNTAKLRTKGWLAVLFFDADDKYSVSAAETLQKWTEALPGDKLAVLGVARGEIDAVKAFAGRQNLTYPIVWDFDDYVVGLYGVNSTPTLIVTDSKGKVLTKIVGDDQPAMDSAKSKVADGVRAAAEAAAQAADAAAAAPAPAPVPAPVAAAPAPAPSSAPTPPASKASKDEPAAKKPAKAKKEK